MPEDVKMEHELEEETTQLVHDDIVKRLLTYQRQLRDEQTEDPSVVAAAEETPPAGEARAEEIIDLTEAEIDVAGSGEMGPAGVASVEERVETTIATGVDLSDRTRDAEIIDISAARFPEAQLGGIALADPPPPRTIEGFGSVSDSAPANAELSTPLSPDAPLLAHEDRIAAMERSVERLSSRFAELRSAFQDMAIAADERLADIEDLISELRTQADS